MSHSPPKVPLGAILQQAGLVSAEQVRQALEQQKQNGKSPRIGEILANKGLINPQTADFFAERWFRIADEQPKQPLGQYLKQAALLNEEQIQIILAEQKQTQVKFGELAIAKGWLKRATLNFFLRYLISNPLGKSGGLATEGQKLPEIKPADTLSQSQGTSLPLSNNFTRCNSPTSTTATSVAPEESGKSNQQRSRDNEEYSQKIHASFLKIKQKVLNIEGQQNYSEQTIERVLFWTGGQSFLTKKLFALIAQQFNPDDQKTDKQQIDYLVKTQVITNWDQELKLHFAGIKQRLLNNRQYQPQELLLLYRQVLAGKGQIDVSSPQQELLKMGLVVEQQHQLMVANRIYYLVFSLGWVAKTLNRQPRPKVPVKVRGGEKLTIVPQSTTNGRHQPSWLQVKNILLLLSIIGLLTILINNLSKRVAVRFAFNRGNQLLQEKSFTPAIAQYNQLLDLDSNYFQAWTNRGYALAGLQKYEEMQESCSTATIIEPQAVYAWNCRGEALHNLKRYTEAVAAFDQAISLNQGDPILLINKSESLGALGRQQESLTVIQEAIRVLEQIETARGRENIGGEFAVALTILGNGLRQQQKYTDAMQAYQRALRYSANYFPAHIGQGITMIRLEKYQAAQNWLEMTLANLPLSVSEQAQTWFHLGKALCQSAEYTKGIAAFETAIELQPDYQAATVARNQCR